MIKNGQLDLFSILVPNSEQPADTDLSQFAVSISEIETVTGLRFIPLLDETINRSVKDQVYPVWQ